VKTTLRRDWLRRQVQAGRVIVVGSYHFDDMQGTSRDTAKGMPAAIAPPDWRERKSGVCYIHPHEFTGNAGRAWKDDATGVITLYVHSNSNYDLRILPPPEESGGLVTSHKYDRRITDAEDAPCVRCGLPREAHEEAQA